MNPARWCLERRLVVLYLVALLAAAGLASYFGLGKLEDPEFTIKTAVVTTVYPGATAAEVEREVTERIEEAVQKMGEVDKVRSLSRPDLSLVYVDIKDAYTTEDLPQIWDVLRRKVHDVQGDLPPGTQTSVVNDDFGDVYGQFYALVGDGYSTRELKDHADELKKQLLLVPGVASVTLTGDQPEGIYVEISRARIAALGLSPQDIYQVLAQQNTLSPVALAEVGDETLRVEPSGGIKTLEDLGDLMIGGGRGTDPNRPGGILRLRDVATLRRAEMDPPRSLFRFNGRPALGLGVSTVKGGNVVEMGEAVEKRLAELQEITPVGMEVRPISLQSRSVVASVNNFVLNLAESLVIVVGVLVVFMGLRSGLLIGAILLLTIGATLATMRVFGIALQSVSLASLIIALGMLVDNAIVVTEGVLVGVEKGEDGAEAAARTVASNLWPLLGATLIAILAFSAIGLSPDSTGEFCRSLFQVMGISLLWSWVLAITVTPLFAVMTFRQPPAGEAGDPYQGRLFSTYRNFLRLALVHRRAAVLLLGGLLALGVFGFRFVDKSFMPEDTSSLFTLDLWRAEGSSIAETSRNLAALESFLLKRPEVDSVTATVGQGTLRFNLTYTAEDPDPAYGQAIVRLKDPEDLDRVLLAAEAFARDHLPGAQVQGKRFAKGGGSQAKLQARLLGPDPAVLRSLGDRIWGIFLEDPSSGFVRTDWRQMEKVLRPRTSEAALRGLGLTLPQVNAGLRASFQGDQVGVLREGKRLLPILSRLPERDRGSADTLKLVQVFSPATGRMIPLGSLVSGVDTVFQDPIVRRRNRERALTVMGDPRPGENSNALFQRLRPRTEALDLPPGYRLEWGGEYESSQKANEGIQKMLPLSLLAMLSILVFLFNSLRQPGIIAACLPLSLVGVTAGLLVFDKPFSFMALLGVLSLVGMLIKNAIVLLDQINLDLKEGMSPYDAVMEAGVSRLRPVMMAAGTTVLGMIPLVSDVLFGPMAVAIMFGLAFATVLTLLGVPALYCLFYRVEVPR